MSESVETCPYCGDPISNGPLTCKWTEPRAMDGFDRPVRTGFCVGFLRRQLEQEEREGKAFLITNICGRDTQS